MDGVEHLVEYNSADLIESQIYNNFFNPNLCHVCKKSNNTSLVSCSRCYMIFYCNKAHQLMHYEQHVQFCEYITEYLRKKHGAQWRSLSLSTSEWIQSRHELLREIEEQYPRKLQTYEEQMILFAKSCYFCHRQNNLYICLRCSSANFCIEHEQDFQEHYLSKCRKLLLCLNLDIMNLENTTYMQKFSEFPKAEKPFDDMESFIVNYVRSYQHTDFGSWSMEYFYSDYVSGPLTFYYGMLNAYLLVRPNMIVDRCTIHVITPCYLEKKYMAAWELLLHLLRHIKWLTIVLIGRELKVESGDIDVCSTCLHHNQKFTFESYSMLYDDYVNSRSFQQPNVLVRFEVDFRKEWTLWKNLLSKHEIVCPLLLTTASQSLVEDNIDQLTTQLEPAPSPRYNARNKFKSMRPWKDLETVWYRNTYVIVYEELVSKLRQF